MWLVIEKKTIKNTNWLNILSQQIDFNAQKSIWRIKQKRRSL